MPRPSTDRIVAALYVEPDGPYANLEGVEVWDEARDARTYAGPHPVVAHPPCNRWSILCHMSSLRWGFKIGDDGGCFAFALEHVRRFGGVLEHPARTIAWKHHGLLRPNGSGWTRSLFDDGWVCQVDQSWHGHKANKPTWLYAVGCDLESFKWGKSPLATALVERMWGGSGERSRTPIPFRDILLSMARSCYDKTAST